jgi:hypothetical protein
MNPPRNKNMMGKGVPLFMQLLDSTRIKCIVSKPIFLIVATGILASVSACSHEDWHRAAISSAREAGLLDLTAWEFEWKLKPYDQSAKCSAIGADMISCEGYFTKSGTAQHLFDEYRKQSGRPWLRLNFQEGPSPFPSKW